MSEVNIVLEELQERLGHLPGFRFRKMFGGVSLYSDGVVFCMITSQAVPHFRIGPRNLDDFVDAGQTPFSPMMKNGKSGQMPYYTIPEEVYNDQVKLEAWAMKAIEAAKEARKK